MITIWRNESLALAISPPIEPVDPNISLVDVLADALCRARPGSTIYLDNYDDDGPYEICIISIPVLGPIAAKGPGWQIAIDSGSPQAAAAAILAMAAAESSSVTAARIKVACE